MPPLTITVACPQCGHAFKVAGDNAKPPRLCVDCIFEKLGVPIDDDF